MKENQSTLVKQLIPVLRQEKFEMSPEYLLSDSEEVLEERWHMSKEHRRRFFTMYSVF